MTLKEIINGALFADRSYPYYVFRINPKNGSLRIYSSSGRFINSLTKLQHNSKAILATSNMIGHTPMALTFYFDRLRPLTVDELVKLTKRL